MKPRNKFEKAVLEQSKHLRPITTTQSKWAFRECIDHFAYRLPKGHTTCMDCGHSWIMNKHRETCTCPHCRAKLQVKETYERKLQQKQYFTILTTCGEFQVLRMFLLIVGMEKGYKAQTSIIEIGQYWWNMLGRKAMVAIQRYWDTMLIPFPIIALWRYATIMKPISILPTHPYIQSSRLQTYFAEMVLRIISMASCLPSLFLHCLQTAVWKHC